MSDRPCKATVLGVPAKKYITDIWVQAAPSINSDILFAVTVGVSGLTVLDVQPDKEKNHYKKKVFQWFKLGFPDGRVGWVRDDFLEINGNCGDYGYGTYAKNTAAFSLERKQEMAAMKDPAKEVDEADKVAKSPLLATITGIPSEETVNLRSGPSTKYDPPVVKLKKDIKDLKVLDVKPDEQDTKFAGKVYQWLKLELPAKKTGWVRDDLVAIQGDGSEFGYDLIQEPIVASTLNRFTRDTEPDKADTGCIGEVVSQVPARIRSGPNVTFSIITQVIPGTKVPVMEVVPQDDGGPYQWVKVRAGDDEGWSRADNFKFMGACGALELTAAPGNIYPSPMKQYRWVRGFTGPNGHRGWDLAFPVGTPVYCGPQGGTVIRAHPCKNCTPEKPSAADHGIPLGDQSVYADPDWGWGFGNHIMMRYDNDKLPESTREFMAQNGMAGWHVFVIYGHLHTMDVPVGKVISGGTQIGTLGNTGNSTGPHLHIEVRAGRDLPPDPWLNMRLIDPVLLFER